MNSFLIYLLQVSVCHMGFYILYRLVFSKHTFFQSNRLYLLSSTMLGFLIPMISIGIWNPGSMDNSYPLLFDSESLAILEPQSVLSGNFKRIFDLPINHGMFLLYVSGFLFFFIKLLLGLWRIFFIIKENKVVDKGTYKLIRLKRGPSFFSFLNYIFINDNNTILYNNDYSHVLSHEKVHVQQRHTYDIFLLELVSAICWFNPIIHIIKNEIRQIHEFIADHQVVINTKDHEQYSRLILRMSSGDHFIPFVHQFSKLNIKNRIIMLNQTKNNAMKTLNYLLTIPMIFLLMSIFSFTEKTNINSINEENQNDEQLTIGEISWKGNTKYSDDFLTEYLGIKKGDPYNKQKIESKFYYNPGSIGITDLYMDSGHLFFSIDTKENIIGKSINLIFEIFEGSVVVFDKIIIKGNVKIETVRVIEMIEFKKGEIFNRSQLIQSQKNIANSGFFKKDKVGIKPIPHPDSKSVDIEFDLIELK